MPDVRSHAPSNSVIDRVVAHLRPVPGVAAIVLGGSRAQGAHTEASDIDIGLYYEPQRPIDIDALRAAAAALDDAHRPDTVTDFGGWGPRINGGGWLRVNDVAVDLIYRDLAKVRQVIDDCRAGVVTVDYQPGHPHGFVSSIYAGEAAVCQPLFDPDAVVEQLKAHALPYPPALKKALVGAFAWEIDFSLRGGEKAAARSDVSYAAGCCFRAVACMNQVLFALNERYLLNEKGATARAQGLAVHPAHFQARVAAAFTALAADAPAIQRAIRELDELNAEIAVAIGSGAA